MKHRINSLCEFSVIRFVDITSDHAKVLQAIMLSILSAELSFAITILFLAPTIHQVFEGDLLCSLWVRKYSIFPGNIIADERSYAPTSISLCFYRVSLEKGPEVNFSNFNLHRKSHPSSSRLRVRSRPHSTVQ
jgi:hypothetical protein